jgi:glycosyltransferase involved in cell wall biosynthesis
MRRATRSIDAFIGPSLFTIRMHRERGVDGTMIQLPLFQSKQTEGSPPTTGAARTRPYFLFVGRLEKIKGVQTIIPLFRRLADVDLLIAGDGEYRRDLEQLAAGADNIVFLGRANGGELHKLYREAIATIIPSICYETFGVVAAESFSEGTPVIVYAQSSLEEIVQTHGGGLMYRTDAELESAIHQLRTDPQLRNRLGREGLDAYKKEFAEDPFIQHYVAVVRELLARKEEEGTVRRSDTDTLLAGRPVFF